jgi:hypothetical protein
MGSTKNLAALLLVALVGGLGGYFVWRTHLYTAAPPAYRLDFGPSQAVTAPTYSSKAFFRKALHLDAPVRQAWLALAASDAFILYLNGERVGQVKYPESVAQNLYDLTTRLTPGKNVIAVEVTRSTYPEPAWVRVAAGYTTREGERRFLGSDPTWRAQVTEDNRLRFADPLRWPDTAFDDLAWPRARPYLGPESTDLPVFLAAWPALFTTPPQGPWLGGPAAAGTISLRRTLTLDRPGPEHVWLRLSALSPYRLSVNGVTAALRPQPEKLFDLVNLKPLLHTGENRLDLEVSRRLGGLGVLVELFIGEADGRLAIHRGDQGWRVFDAPAASLAPYPSYPGFTLAQQPKPLAWPWWWTWWNLGAALGCICLGALATLAHWRLWTVLWRRPADDGAAFRLAYWHLPAALFLIALFFLQFDIRFDPAWPFRDRSLLIALGLILAGQALGGLGPRQVRP